MGNNTLPRGCDKKEKQQTKLETSLCQSSKVQKKAIQNKQNNTFGWKSEFVSITF